MATYTLQQVAEHNSPQDAWIAIHGNVYDVSKYTDSHPGGRELLIEVAGTDATQDFEYAGHSKSAQRTLKTLQIGALENWVKKQDVALSGFSPQVTKDPIVPRASTRKLLPATGVVIVCGIALLLYARGTPGDEHPGLPDWFWAKSGVVLAMIVALGGFAGLSIRNMIFVHGKGAFEYPPYYHRPVYVS